MSFPTVRFDPDASTWFDGDPFTCDPSRMKMADSETPTGAISNVATSYLALAATELAGKVLGDRALGDDCPADPGQAGAGQAGAGQAGAGQAGAGQAGTGKADAGQANRVNELLDDAQRDRLRGYLRDAGELDGLKRRYGKDKTFVVPILTNMAIAGLVPWSSVSALPFEAAVFPQSWYRFLKMPVVSYAIPALVAIGQARHFLGPKSFFALRWIRSASLNRTMQVLQRMQPESGGYLEATPLTSFVLMSLAVTGRGSHPVAKSCLRFLEDSMTEEGSWPIDTNLATWVTSLSIHALACDPDDDGEWFQPSLLDWHLGCQHRERHPFTGADPGGWGWTDLTGAVPDADDTPAAILALDRMRTHADEQGKREIENAVRNGHDWLTKLQNRDGGWPTFCRGWGKLPFDRSSTDLTAHALRAFGVDPNENPQGSDSGERGGSESGRPSLSDAARRKAVTFLTRHQRTDGSWLPLWFGNQDLPDDINPVYGTAKVLISGMVDEESADRGRGFLLRAQNPDGGWGGGSSISKYLSRLKKTKTEFAEIKIPGDLVSSVEETALAVEALATIRLQRRSRLDLDQENVREIGGDSSDPAIRTGPSGVLTGQGLIDGASDETGRDLAAIIGGVRFLVNSVRDDRHRVAWPIGFYFAKLWYHEQLYPLIFTVAAIGKFLRITDDRYDADWPR